MSVPAAPVVARALADALEAARVPYAIGGALALGVWGFPRATNDVDVDVFVEAAGLRAVLEHLQRSGFDVEVDEALRSAAERGDLRLYLDAMRIDVFTPSIPLYASASTRRREAPLEGRPAWFLAPEDLAVFKLLFFRTKDLLDVERLVAFLGSDFDRAYVRRWLAETVGADDERVARWDRLLADVDAAGG